MNKILGRCVLILVLILLAKISNTAMVYGQTTYFCAKYCFLGTRVNGISTFICSTPKPQVDIISAALVLSQHNKAANQVIKFRCSLSYTGPTTSTFNIQLDLQQPNSIKISFGLLIIKAQITTHFVDLVQFQWNTGSPIDNHNNVVRVETQVSNITTSTIFTSGTSGLVLVSFVTYFAMTPPMNSSNQYDPSVNLKFLLQPTILSATQIQITLTVQPLTAINYLKFFIIMYSPTALASVPTNSQRNHPFVMGPGLYANYDLLVYRPGIGPPWDLKCVVGMNGLQYFGQASFTYQYLPSILGNFQNYDQTQDTGSPYLTGALFCIVNSLQCRQNTPFFDYISNTCILQPSCPLAIPTGWDITYPNECPNCTQLICTRCASANRTYCTTCAINSTADPTTHICSCNYGYSPRYQIISGVAWATSSLKQCVYINCSLQMPGCLDDHCSTQTFCTDCEVRYFVNSQNLTYQTCQPCNNTLTLNCTSCTDQDHCTICDAGFYLKDKFSLTLVLIGQYCQGCSIPLPHCVNCSNNLTCTDCQIGYTWNGTNCNCDLTLISDCLACTLAQKCDNCSVGFYVNLTSYQCWRCNNIDFYCTQCLNQNTCTLCDPGYGTDLNTTSSKIQCTLCSLLISHCDLCQNNTQCFDCSYNFGLNSTSFCQNCSTLVCTGCIACQNSTQCLQCNTDSFLINGSCFFCQQQHYKCQTCMIDSSGSQLDCILCQVGFFLNILSSTPFLITECRTCKIVTSDCAECTPDGTACTKCQIPYLIGITGICDRCVSGYVMIDEFCAKLGGCQISIIENGKQICLSCCTQLNFVYQSKTKQCICAIGFKQINKPPKPRFCESVCGDGITVVQYEECDDNNTLNDDGCSKQCKKQSDYQCSVQSPSKCVLYVTQFQFSYSYAYRVEGQNKGIIYYKITSSHSNLASLKWSQLLKFEYQPSHLVDSVQIASLNYDTTTGLLALTLAFSQDLEQQSIKATLKLDSNYIVLSPSSGGNPQIKLMNQMIGINAPLIFQESSTLQTFKKVETLSLIIICVLFVIFYLSSYWHKMIGLETINIIQTLYFSRMIAPSKSTSLLNSFNLIQYSASGFSQPDFIFGDQVSSIKMNTFQTIQKQFISIGLQKYFLMNINFTLIIVFLLIGIYVFTLYRKTNKRTKFLKTKDQLDKDLYIQYRRQNEWIYGNFVFPNTMMLNMISFFNTILYIKPLQSQNSQSQNTQDYPGIQFLSFSFHLIILMITFFIYSFEIFTSYELYSKSKLTQDQRNKLPQTAIQKLQRDQNSPYRPNYNALYVLIYLVFYFILQSTIIIGVLINGLQNGLQIVLSLNIIYFVFICIYKPYFNSIKIHNNLLKLNHFTVVLFLIICQVLSKFDGMSQQIYIILTYLIAALMVLILIGAFFRLLAQKKYRENIPNQQQVQQKNKIQEEIQTLLKKKQMLIYNNPYIYKGPSRVDPEFKAQQKINNLQKYVQKQQALFNRLNMNEIESPNLSQQNTENQKQLKKQLKKDRNVLNTRKKPLQLLKSMRDQINKL